MGEKCFNDSVGHLLESVGHLWPNQITTESIGCAWWTYVMKVISPLVHTRGVRLPIQVVKGTHLFQLFDNSFNACIDSADGLPEIFNVREPALGQVRSGLMGG